MSKFLAGILSLLIDKYLKRLMDWVSRQLKRKEEKDEVRQETTGKVEDYVKAETAQERRDTFDRMP